MTATVEPPPAAAAELPGQAPHYPSASRWLTAGFQRYPKATVVALLLGWTGSIVPVWAALAVGFGLVLAFVFAGIFHIGTIGSILGYAPSGAVVSGGVVAAVFGACLTFLNAYVGTVLADPSRLLITLLVGAGVTTIVAAGYGLFEETILRFTGYRRLSREEGVLIAPLLQDAADKLNLGTLPRVAIHDDKQPRAAAGVRTILLSAGLLEMFKSTPNELEAVIAHELAHWARADAIGRIFVWAAGWPLIVLYEGGAFIGRVSQGKSRLVAVLGFVASFPASILINAILIPVLSKESRESEYAADALVNEAGLGDALAGS